MMAGFGRAVAEREGGTSYPKAAIPPINDGITEYDREHPSLFMFLIDGTAPGNIWDTLPPHIMDIDPQKEPARAEAPFNANLARAKWFVEIGHGRLPKTNKTCT
jgi:hypothetical protein